MKNYLKKTRLFAVLLTVCMLFSVFPANINAEEEESNDLVWTLDAEGNMVFKGKGEMPAHFFDSDPSWGEMASQIKTVVFEEGMTTICDEAFSACNNLESVVLPDSLKEIGKSAFAYCRSLKSINIPEGVKKIGEYAFNQCMQLEGITLPDSLTECGEYAFGGCRKISRVNIPANLTEIPTGLFYDCTSIAGTIEIPDGIKKIGEYAFGYCSSLTKVSIPASVEEIDSFNPFRGCVNLSDITIDSNNKNYVMQNGGLYNSDMTAMYAYLPGRTEELFTIPATITELKPFVFTKSENLKSVILPQGLTFIGDGAFFESGIESISIPASVESIGGFTFYCCSDLKSVVFEEETKLDTLDYSVFEYCTSLSDIVIPDSIKKIGNETFAGCTSLNKINISENIEYIGSNAFEDAGVLINTDYVNGIKYIDKWAVECSLSAVNPVVEDGTTGIADGVFADNSDVQTIDIPASVTKLTIWAFYGSENITGIFVDSANKNFTSIDGNLFSKDLSTIIFYAAGKPEESYTLPDGVKEIGDWSFGNVLNLKEVVMPTSVEVIGEYAFCGCVLLKNAELPQKLKTIKLAAFLDCYDIDEVEVPDTVEYIGDYAFGSTGYYMNDDNWEDNMLVSGKWIIEDKNNYDNSLTVEDGIIGIANYAFSDCDVSNVLSVTLPSSLKYVGEGLFDNFANLADVYYNGTEDEWKNIVIEDCNEPLTNAALHCTKWIDEPVLKGDVDLSGKVDLADAALCLKAALGIVEIDDSQQSAADVNEDGSVDLTDTVLILKMALGIAV